MHVYFSLLKTGDTDKKAGKYCMGNDRYSSNQRAGSAGSGGIMTEKWDLGCIQKGKESASTGWWGCLRCWNAVLPAEVGVLLSGHRGSRHAQGAGMLQPLHLPVPTWANQNSNKEIPCPPWSKGAASVHGAVRRRQTNREVQLHCQPTLTVCWERFPTLSLPGAIHQQLWDKREDLSKLCLPFSLDFPPATSIFSLGEHKIKSAFGLWTHVSSSRISCSTRLQLSAPSTGHHQHLPPPPLTQQRDNTEPRLEWLKLYFN